MARSFYYREGLSSVGRVTLWVSHELLRKQGLGRSRDARLRAAALATGINFTSPLDVSVTEDECGVTFHAVGRAVEGKQD